MNLFNRLTETHLELINQLNSLLTTDISQETAFSLAFDNLLFHLEMEEEFLYPALQSITETKTLTEQALKEHYAIKCLIRELFKDKLNSQTLQGKVEDFLDSEEAQEAIAELFQGKLESQKIQDKITLLQEAIKLHFQKEEKALFSLAQQMLPLEVQSQIQAQMLQTKNYRKQEQSVSVQ